jgi:hypothetical protein
MLRLRINKKILIVAGVILIIASAGFVFADEMGYFPRYPSRISALAKELALATDDLTFYNQELGKEAQKCSCSNSQSNCQMGSFEILTGSTKAFGEICPNRREIENTQIEIDNKIDQVVYLRNLLIAEMQSGLDDELKTLREDDAKQLKASLDKIIADSDKIVPLARSNASILDDKRYSSQYQCSPNCSKENLFSIKACLLFTVGEQTPIRFNFSVNLGLQDLDLGKLGLSSIKLNLPDKIDLGKVIGAQDSNISLPDLNLTFKPTKLADLDSLSLDSIIFHPSSPTIPDFNPSGFSCPEFQNNQYQCSSENDKGSELHYNALEWYLQTLSWLSEKCQELPGTQDENGFPVEENIKKCLNEKVVFTYIAEDCDKLWGEYLGCILAGLPDSCRLPEICKSIKRPSQRVDAQNRECLNLFSQLNETAPVNCSLQVFEDRCNLLKEETENSPEPCKYLPIFTGRLENPDSITYQSQASQCEAQTMSSNPQSINLYCPNRSYSSPAKIKIQSIKIPDFYLPSFDFMPFLKVKLPNFIFEDLTFPEMKLCDINDCKNILPALTLNYNQPVLRIPPVKIPSIYINLPDIPGFPKIKGKVTELKMDDIQFPSIALSLPKLDLKDLISLNLEVPKIPKPQPQVTVNFEGVKFNFLNFLLGMLSTVIPMPSGCISMSVSFIPLIISFPDYHFYWPKFPQMPNLCEGVNEFCRQLRKSLEKDVGGRLDEIEAVLNKTIAGTVQKKLDNAAAIYNKIMTEQITDRMYEIKDLVENNLASSFLKAYVKDGFLNIPNTTIPLGTLKIPMSAGNSLLSAIPTQITIPWPNELKEIKLSDVIGYQLPSIPLSKLGYKKTFEIKIGGFQSASLQVILPGQNISFNTDTPSGGNPYPTGQMGTNTNSINNYSDEIEKSMEEISNILD